VEACAVLHACRGLFESARGCSARLGDAFASNPTAQSAELCTIKAEKVGSSNIDYSVESVRRVASSTEMDLCIGYRGIGGDAVRWQQRQAV